MNGDMEIELIVNPIRFTYVRFENESGLGNTLDQKRTYIWD